MKRINFWFISFIIQSILLDAATRSQFHNFFDYSFVYIFFRMLTTYACLPSIDMKNNFQPNKRHNYKTEYRQKNTLESIQRKA